MTYPHDGTDAETLLENGDLALYRAKHEGRQEGRGKYLLFDRAMNAEGVEDAGQLDVLRRRGCDEARGSYVSRPLDPGGDVDVIANFTPDGLRAASRIA